MMTRAAPGAERGHGSEMCRRYAAMRSSVLDIGNSCQREKPGGRNLHDPDTSAIVEEAHSVCILGRGDGLGCIKVEDRKPSRSKQVCRDVSGQPGEVDGECDGIR
jgi:hypothetical protein